MKKLIEVFILIFTLSLPFIACSENEDNTTYYTVTFVTEDGTKISSQKIEEGKTAIKPANPEPVTDDSEFVGWYSLENLSPKSEINQIYTFYNNGNQFYYFDFSTKITKNLTLYFYAVWNADYITIDSTDEDEIFLPF